MATIPRAALDYLTEQINACSADAQAKALKLLEKIDWSDVAAARQAVVDAINILVAEYGLASAQAAADFYDASRELCTGEKLGAKAYTVHDPRATEGAIRAFVSRIVKNGDIDGFNKAACSRIGYEIRRDANECIAENGAKDPLKPKFARVPGGGETCGFCLMLASFGYNYNSRQSASHAHDNCDCRIVCSWDDDGAEGYDPDGMYERHNKVLDSIGGRNGIRDEWDALPEEERDAYIARHGGKQGKAFDAFLNNRVSSEIERRDPRWFKTGNAPIETYQSARAKKELNASERLTCKTLRENGFAQHILERSNEHGVKTADVLIGSSMVRADYKTPRGDGFNSIDRLMRDAGKKADIAIIHLIEGESTMSMESAIKHFQKCGKRRGINEAIVIDYSGDIRRVKI